MEDLTKKKCVPCENDGFPALTPAQAADMMEHVPGWELSSTSTMLSRHFKFKNFAEALAFANKIGEIAEEENHHPDLTVSWGKVGVMLTTHSIKGLSENDFILAAKINLLPV